MIQKKKKSLLLSKEPILLADTWHPCSASTCIEVDQVLLSPAELETLVSKLFFLWLSFILLNFLTTTEQGSFIFHWWQLAALPYAFLSNSISPFVLSGSALLFPANLIMKESWQLKKIQIWERSTRHARRINEIQLHASSAAKFN